MLREIAASMLERGDTGFRDYAGNDEVCAGPSLALAAHDGLHISLNRTPDWQSRLQPGPGARCVEVGWLELRLLVMAQRTTDQFGGDVHNLDHASQFFAIYVYTLLTRQGFTPEIRLTGCKAYRDMANPRLHQVKARASRL